MASRALELLALEPDEPAFLLDIGCGSGLSGEILTDEGYEWVGVDVAPSMLEVALEREVEGDLFLQDIGQGFGFRPGSFDGAISCVLSNRQYTELLPPNYSNDQSLIRSVSFCRLPYLSRSVSVLQWLFNSDAKSHNPIQRLNRFFTTLHSALKRPSRAVLQFYPESDDQVHLALSTAMKAGFTGGLVVDYPNSRKAKKFFLCLMVGSTAGQMSQRQAQMELPKGLEGEEETIRNERKREKASGGRRKNIKDASKEKGTKEWVLRKKELDRKRGSEKSCVLLSSLLHDLGRRVEPLPDRLLSTSALQDTPRLEVHGQKSKNSFLSAPPHSSLSTFSPFCLMILMMPFSFLTPGRW